MFLIDLMQVVILSSLPSLNTSSFHEGLKNLLDKI